jgi:hypothetical protein
MRPIGVLVACGALCLALAWVGASNGSRQFRVAFVTDIISTNPHDLRGVAYLGFLRAVKDFRVEGRAVASNPKTGLGPTLTGLARERYDLIYTRTGGERVFDRPTIVSGGMVRSEQLGEGALRGEAVVGHLACRSSLAGRSMAAARPMSPNRMREPIAQA